MVDRKCGCILSTSDTEPCLWFMRLQSNVVTATAICVNAFAKVEDLHFLECFI